MKMDIEFRPGRSEKVAVVFIHGLGMSKHIWTSPYEESILGGLTGLGLLLKEKPERVRFSSRPRVEPEPIFTGINPVEVRTLFHDLSEEGYPVVTWSQKRPAGPVREVVKELEGVISFASSLTKRGIILVGHSRGGLIARKYLEENKKDIKMLITISTPHRGSTMARWVSFLSPLARIIESFIGESMKSRVMLALRRITDFLKSEAIMELMPDSLFMRSFKPVEGVRFITIGGTDPELFSFWRWRYSHSEEGHYLVPERVFSFPESILNVIPDAIAPEEWIGGEGDGLVSVKSAVSLDSTQSEVFAVNHARILIDRPAREFIKGAIETFVD